MVRLESQSQLMENPEPVSPGRSMLKVSRRKRKLLGAFMLAGCFLAIVLDKWMLGAGRAIYLLTIPLGIYILLLIFRPQWIARMEKKEEERLKNWGTHPGRWMR